jgi:transcriptional regulator with XRE-family HTH domain
METDDLDLQLRLRFDEIRAEEGWTQQQLAERLGRNTNQVGQYERGDVGFTRDTLYHFAQGLHRNAWELIKHPWNSLPPSIKETVEVMQQLDEADREVVRSLARSLAARRQGGP